MAVALRLAVISQVPAARIVTVLPSTVQTPVVLEAKLTVLSSVFVVVALTLKGKSS